MSAITLLTGENLFALTEEKLRWLREYRSRHGAENLIRRSITSSVPLRDLLDDVTAAPFVAAKRLVMYEGIPVHIEKEGMAALERSMHGDCVLLIVDPKPDKRYASVKELLKIADVREFTLVRGKALQTWALGMLQKLGATIEGDALETLIGNCGEDQNLIAAELPKLALSVGSRPIRKEDVSALSPLSGEREVWELLKRIVAGDVRGALTFVDALLRQGDAPQALWAHLLWILESLVTLAVCVREHKGNAAASAQRLGVAPMTARSLLPLAAAVPFDRLQSLLEECVASDCAVKTGQYRVTADAPEELVALVEKAVLELATLRK